jgi:predicted ATP-dependent protease
MRALVFPAANVKDVGDIPEDVRDRLELFPVEAMDEVFEVALHRVIVPQRIAGDFVIEIEDDEDESEDDETEARRATARPGRRSPRRQA